MFREEAALGFRFHLTMDEFIQNCKAVLETLEPALRNLVAMSMLVCSPLSALQSGSAWLKPLLFTGNRS